MTRLDLLTGLQALGLLFAVLGDLLDSTLTMTLGIGVFGLALAAAFAVWGAMLVEGTRTWTATPERIRKKSL
ncbi:hypothetical protein [Natronomonas sp. EA1]|uniref:hypothetical protein n=1 Tax=Natronomonas sp. EA1 TaxID=3421655 RepID=UPI003EB9E7BC